MAHPGGRTAASLPNGVQLLSTILNQPSRHLLPAKCHAPEFQHRLWVDRRLYPRLCRHRGTSRKIFPMSFIRLTCEKVSTGQYQHLTYRFITMMRGGLISMLYGKATDIALTDVDPASSITLMSADIERIVTGFQTGHEIWANTLEVGLAIYLLERQLGVACAIPIGVAVGKSY